ncbi:unnamed protein product [Rhizophagus irregularis]|nr:unnamed protein product [Rhizophagus irregularis]
MRPVSGRKKDKTRVTVLLGVNTTETDKLKPWIIGNSKRSRPLSKVNLGHLPVYYRGNSKTWMNSSVFEEVLHEMDRNFRIQDKKILLLIDNVLSHFDPHYSPALEIEQNDDDDASNGKGHGGRVGESRGHGGCVSGSRSRGGYLRGRRSCLEDSYRDRSNGHQPDRHLPDLTNLC